MFFYWEREHLLNIPGISHMLDLQCSNHPKEQLKYLQLID